jgi:phosphoribosylformylglycinamidine synthase
LSAYKPGEVHAVPISHGEGKFVASLEQIKKLEKNGQIATQYVNLNNNATMLMPFNPNGSLYAVEGITSQDGRIFGKMGHSERVGQNLYKNVIDKYEQKIFECGVKYFSRGK